jgi:hypothetical protein
MMQAAIDSLCTALAAIELVDDETLNSEQLVKLAIVH